MLDRSVPAAVPIGSRRCLSPSLDGRAIELVLWCDETDGEFRRLTAAGAKALSKPHDWLDGLRVAWVADPDLNPIQLVLGGDL
jgi:hypothetical protein